ncbi:fasciclin domain-containing protein [Chitinophaga dinghuensis]|uniref:Fasciclin domain-containing protein n=1 Tax=Chitinophaga dinghuensis TaxID=1539050 RepID=A0A327VQB7_9BACT|nr:fasciclin domain-containing protein [Chitinophaga dinghuensis]RAJ76646.1 fasciclin domain-containing protein [Chitinophaga dinghuensis]
MRRIIFCTLAFVGLITACRKTEFQRPPVGGQVPYTDTATSDLTTLLSKSPQQLFYTAWQKSHLDSLLKSQGKGIRFTVLAPDDAAMKAAGLTADKIAAAKVADLDSLLLFHVIPENIDSAALRGQQGNVRHRSLLKDRTIKEQVTRPGSNVLYTEAYTYKLYFGMTTDGSLLINGKNSGKVAPMYAKNGVIYPITKPLVRPTKTVMDVINTDPRFSILSGIFRAMDSTWEEVTYGFYERKQYQWMQLRIGNVVSSDGFFAPTNEAFKKAGFNSVDDLMNLNARSMPYLDEEDWEMHNGLFVTDSLLAYSFWGRMYTPRSSIGGGAGVSAMFWSNDLNNAMLGTFALSTSGDNAVPLYLMPLDFGINGGLVTVKVKGSSHPAATIVEADIPTLQGPFHAVDNLILSDKVKF